MKKNTIKIILVMAVLLAAIAIYSNLKTVYESVGVETGEVEQQEELQEVKFAENPGENETVHIRDKNLLYDDDNEVTTMYLTVQKGNASEGTDHTWEEINTYSAYDYREWGIDRYQVEGLLQVGNEQGITPGSFGYGKTAPNATVQIRGQTSSRNAQKNYKIEIKKNQGTWNGQRTIALNKHQTDGLRFRNKLGFDLLKGIDQLMSLRTSFVHLYVNDLTDGTDDGFVDYGLYTQVEQLNKTALRAHGLDKNGHLYKINFFEFFRYEDSIKLVSDPSYDQKKFEYYLEIKGDNDHSKLIKMLEDVNDLSIPIEEVIEKHFDEENLRYWLAFNILIGNVDTQSRNAYIYSPLNSETWYFYCWDIDASLRYDEDVLENRTEYGSWEEGISNYWGNVLFQRYLKSDNYRAKLDETITELKNYLSKERISSMIKDYRTVTEQYVYRLPDSNNEALTREEYDKVADGLPNLIDFYYKGYLASLEKPLPFYIGTPEIADGVMNYKWENSYDFEQDEIKYRAVVARDADVTDIVARYEGNWPGFTGDILPPGQYFLKVEAIDEEGNVQDAFDYYVNENSSKMYGRICFYVTLNGKVSLSDGDDL
jgi:spore coat protein H